MKLKSFPPPLPFVFVKPMFYVGGDVVEDGRWRFCGLHLANFCPVDELQLVMGFYSEHFGFSFFPVVNGKEW